MVHILRHRERSEKEFGMSVETVGGPRDGQKFRMVKAEMDDGSIRWLWVSNNSHGYFKRVFVPWDFEHPKIIP